MNQDPNITITESARIAIADLQVKNNNPELSLRLNVLGGGCAGFSYQIEMAGKPQEGDVVFGQNGTFVLIHPKVLKFIEGLELDYERSLGKEGFRFNNPKAKSTCGCGTSFSL